MRKLKLFFACLLMAVLSIGQVWGASPATLSFSAACGGSGTDSDGNSWTISSDGSESTFDNTKGIHYGTGSAQVKYIRLSTSGISGTITQVVVNASTASGVSATAAVKVGTTDFTCNSSTTASLSANATDYTFTGSASGDILVEITKPSKATKAIYCKSVVVTYTSGGVVAVESVSLDEDAISLTIDGVEQQTLTATVLPENATNKNVTWESDNEDVATVVNGVVTAVGAGDATITCKSVADETKYAECAVHVNPSPYSKSNLIFEAACGGTGTADDDAEWTVTSDGAESVYDATSGIHYGTGSANVTYLQLATSDIVGSVVKVVVNARDAQAKATISVTVGGTAFTCSETTATNTSTDYTFTGTGSGEIVVRVDRGSSMSKAIYVKSVKVSYIPSASIKKPSFSVEGGSYLGAQEVEITCATAEANIFYTLDGNDPTSESTPYNGAINISETKTLKAIAIKDEVLSPIASATYTIWDEPLSVADAIALIPNNNDQVNDQFVEGYVCTAAPSLLADGKLTYYISADGSETDRLQIYKGKNLDNTEFSNVNDLAIGDKVIIFGQLKNYSGTKEMNDGNYIVRRTAKGALSSVVVSGTPTKTAYSSGDTFEPAGLVVTATYVSGYAVNVASELVAADWSATPATVTENGNISVTATYGGKTSAAYLVPVTVVAATLDHISLSYDAVEVYQGKPLPKPVVTAHWSDASTSDVTALASFTGYDKDTPGDQTITVSYQFGTGDPEEATYTVTVKPIYNVELAASVAKDLIETVVGNTESTSDMIVRGKVSYINNASSNAQTYWISDDGTRTNEVEIFKGKYLSGADFTSANQLRVGDEVVVIGKVINYNNSTPEFANGKSEVQSHVRTPNFAITDVTALEVGATDLAVADLTINVEGEGAVTFASSDNTDAVTIVDGKLHAVAAGVGDATITANLAADGIYKAASTTFNVHVIAATVKYAITFSGNGATGGTAPTAIPDKAAGAEVTLPANTYTYTGHSFTGWKVYDENEDEVTVTANAFTMPASPVTIKAQWAEISSWASVYTSNVTIASNEEKQVTIDGEDYAAAKTNKGTSATITLPQGVTTLHLHLVAWKSEAQTVTVSGDCFNEDKNLTILANDAVSGTVAKYDLGESGVDYYFSLTPDKAVTANEVITITAASGKRFVLFGVNQEGGIVPVLDHITITGTMTNTTGWKTGDNIVPEGLTVNAIYTLNNVEQTPVEVDPNDVVWSHAALTEGQTEVTLNASYTDGVEKTANTNVTIEAVVTGEPSITTDVNSRSWTVNKGAAIPATKTFAVTLKNIASATVTPGGDNPDAFNITPATLTASGNITVSVVSTATVGTYTATITIKDDASATSKVVNVSLTVENEEVPVSTTSEWVAATDADLVDGAEVLITGVASEVTYAIGEDRGNNRAAVAGTLSEGVFTPGANTMSFILEDQGDGTFALRASNGNYLYAASSSANQLKTRAAIEDGDAKWTLTATSAIANGSNTNETIRFNSTNDPKIFSCYADETKQLAIAFYVPKPVTKYTVTFDKNDGSATTSVEVNAGEKVAKPADPIREGFTFNYWTLNSVEYDFDASVTEDITLVADWTENPAPSYETVRTGLEVNRYYTVCLPKKVTAIKGASFWTLNNKSQDGATAYLEEETNNLPFAAGKPFIIQATADKLEVVYEGEATETAGVNGAIHGTLTYMDADALAAAGSDVYMLFNNVLRPVGENNHLDANRAYVKLSELTPVSSAPQGAPGKRVVAMPMQKDQAQGFENLDASEKPLKVMIDGTMYILRGEKVYDATGRLVK